MSTRSLPPFFSWLVLSSIWASCPLEEAVAGGGPSYAVPDSGGPVEWALFTGATVEGASPNDPLGMVTGASSYDSSTGLFTFVTSASAVESSGSREAMPRWSFPLVDVYPDYEVYTNRVELLWVPAAAVPATVAGWGIVLGLFDGPSASYATQSGTSTVWYELPVAGTYRAARQSVTGLTPTRNLPGSPILTGFWLQLEVSQSTVATGVATVGNHRQDGASLWQYSLEEFSLDPLDLSSDVHVQVGLPHSLAVASAGEVWSGYLYTRLILLTSPP